MQSRSFDAIGERMFMAGLENGLRLRILPKKGFHTAYAVFAARCGGAHRRFTLDGRTEETPAGTAHFLEHKLFDMPDGEDVLARLSANGAEPNAFTSAGATAYYFQCAERFEENLELLLRLVSTPYFTEETVEKEKPIIAQEIRMGEDDPDTTLYYRLMRMLYAHHPIREPVAGTEESIAQISADTLYRCHRAFYAPGNMVLCVAGDVDPGAVEHAAFRVLPTERRSVPEADFGERERLEPLERRFSAAMPVSSRQFLLGAKLRPDEPGPEALRRRLTASLALRTLLGRSSPFYTGLYAKGLLNRDFEYEASFSAGTATLLLGGESEDPDAVQAALAAELERAASQGLDAGRFERAKRAGFGSRLRALEDFETVCLSTAFGLFDGYCALEAPELLEQVTQEDCERFLRDELPAERLALAVYEPKKDDAP